MVNPLYDQTKVGASREHFCSGTVHFVAARDARSAKLPTMKVEPAESLKRDREAEAASLARARADIKAGRMVDHDEVAKWLKTWGTEHEQPMPREWLE